MSCSTKGSSRMVIIFKRVHSTLGGGDQWSPHAYKKVDYDALHFHTGLVKSTLSKYSFGREGGGHKNSALCTLFIMLTILDDP